MRPTITAIALILVFSTWSRAVEQPSFIAKLRAGEKQTVVTYGTSLTAGGAWVKQLGDALEQQFPGLANVINSGEGSKWSKWGVDHVEKLVNSKSPDAVFIEFSINDGFLEYKTTPEEARKNLETMIDSILAKRPTCQVILMTMNPPTGKHLDRRPEYPKYAENYRVVAKERGLLLIDHDVNWAKILKEEPERFKEYVPDGIHPNALGCEKVILPQLKASLGLK